jgi:hypothetical protein
MSACSCSQRRSVSGHTSVTCILGSNGGVVGWVFQVAVLDEYMEDSRLGRRGLRRVADRSVKLPSLFEPTRLLAHQFAPDGGDERLITVEA